MTPQEMKKLDKFLIEKCMKWKWLDEFKMWFPSADQLGRTVQIDDGYSKKTWHPTTSIEQAMMCVEKFIDSDHEVFINCQIKGIWNCEINKGKNQYYSPANNTPELAICLAIEKALEVNHGS